VLSFQGAISGKIRERPLIRVEYNSAYLPIASGGAPIYIELDAPAPFESIITTGYSVERSGLRYQGSHARN
jgi:hypothetical protein